MPQRVKEALILSLGLAFLLGFSTLTLQAFWNVEYVRIGEACKPMQSSYVERETDDGSKDYLGTLIASLISGVVAVAFGLPRKESARPWPRAREWLTGAYAVTYCALGIGAVAVWARHDACSGIYVKNLAVTFFGMALAIVGKSLREET